MPKKKIEITSSFKRHDADTGSPEVQIANLSKEIEVLQGHLSLHIHDYDAKRSILKKVARRRRLMKFLKDTNIEAYTKVSGELGLKV